MSPAKNSVTAVRLDWPLVLVAPAIAVGGALAMTVILGLAAIAGTAFRGVPSSQVPLLLTTDSAFPIFCAAAGVACALAAGYITARARSGALLRHAIVSSTLTVALHVVVVGALGSPLSPFATAVYIGSTLPALTAGCLLGAPHSELT
jgi:hypothetical protein